MKTLTDTELAGFRPVPREMLRPTDEDRRAIREQFRSGVRKKVTNATFQAVNGEDSPRFQKLRQQPLRVAYYICYNGSVPIDRMTAQALKRPFEELLRNTPSWTYGVFFVDQCDPSTPLMKRPAFAKMLDANNTDLLLCKSISHLHSNPAVALEAVTVLSRCGIPVYFETEDAYSGNPSDMRNLRVMVGLDTLQEKAATWEGEVIE